MDFLVMIKIPVKNKFSLFWFLISKFFFSKEKLQHDAKSGGLNIQKKPPSPIKDKRIFTICEQPQIMIHLFLYGEKKGDGLEKKEIIGLIYYICRSPKILSTFIIAFN